MYGTQWDFFRKNRYWRPHTIALLHPCVRIRYFSDAQTMYEDEKWYETDLTSDNGESFSDGELLFKLHNAVIDRIKENFHRWFEGLSLEGVLDTGVPIYLLGLGS
jgi:hypothetical protein